MSLNLTYFFRQSLFQFLKRGFHNLENFLYPLKCLKCGRYINPHRVEPGTIETCFCDTCMKAGFFPVNPPYCIKCGIQFHHTFSHEYVIDKSDNHLCHSCIKTPLKAEKARAAVEYKGIIKDAVPLFKYSSKLAAATVFESLLFQAFLKYYSDSRIDLIMPMPLHRTKARKRGFNQTFLMIRNFVKLYRQHFGKNPSWRIDTGSLVRSKKTEPQTGFDIDQRKNNLKNAFKASKPDLIKNRNILLVDDVMTTGATCNEAAMELLRSGAGRVDILVLART